MADITQPGTKAAAEVTVQPVAGRIGAEISGVDISQPLDPQTVAIIQQALDTWKVVFFRGQHLDHAAQITFGRQFGELTYAHPHDDAPPEAYPEIYTVDARRFQQRFGTGAEKEQAARKYSYTSGWHSDVTPAVNPERVLHRVTLIGEVPVGPDGRESELIEGTRFVSEPVFASAGR